MILQPRFVAVSDINFNLLICAPQREFLNVILCP